MWAALACTCNSSDALLAEGGKMICTSPWCFHQHLLSQRCRHTNQMSKAFHQQRRIQLWKKHLLICSKLTGCIKSLSPSASGIPIERFHWLRALPPTPAAKPGEIQWINTPFHHHGLPQAQHAQYFKSTHQIAHVPFSVLIYKFWS